MPMSFDANNRQPLYTYVNRYSKSQKTELCPPSTVFNAFVPQVRNEVLVQDVECFDPFRPPQSFSSIIREISTAEQSLMHKDQTASKVKKTREVTVQRVEEGPPGIHGVIVEVDLGKSKTENATTDDCLKMYALRVVEEKVIEEITSDSEEELPCDEPMEESQSKSVA